MDLAVLNCINCGNSLVGSQRVAETSDVEIAEHLDEDSRPECEMEQDSDDENLNTVDVEVEMAFVFGKYLYGD